MTGPIFFLTVTKESNVPAYSFAYTTAITSTHIPTRISTALREFNRIIWQLSRYKYFILKGKNIYWNTLFEHCLNIISLQWFVRWDQMKIPFRVKEAKFINATVRFCPLVWLSINCGRNQWESWVWLLLSSILEKSKPYWIKPITYWSDIWHSNL